MMLEAVGSIKKSQPVVTSAVAAGTENSGILNAALWYASLGLKVFPCKADKSPLVRWKEEMSSDTEQIQSWWRANPYAMIGLPCGSVNGIVVLDIDIKGDVNGFESLNSKGFEIPDGSFATSTPSSGRHYYFKLRNGEIIRNSASKIGAGVDVRGEGGYVIAPPSKSGVGEYALSPACSWDQFMELVQ